MRAARQPCRSAHCGATVLALPSGRAVRGAVLRSRHVLADGRSSRRRRPRPTRSSRRASPTGAWCWSIVREAGRCVVLVGSDRRAAPGEAIRSDDRACASRAVSRSWRWSPGSPERVVEPSPQLRRSARESPGTGWRSRRSLVAAPRWLRHVATLDHRQPPVLRHGRQPGGQDLADVHGRDAGAAIGGGQAVGHHDHAERAGRRDGRRARSRAPGASAPR